MKKCLLLLAGITIMFAALCQRVRKPIESFYLFDANMKGVKEQSKSTYLLRMLNYNDTLWRWDMYQTMGPLVSVKYFKDNAGTTPHGKCTYYNWNGVIDSVVNFEKGHRNGSAFFYNVKDKGIIERKFRNDTLIAEINLRLKDSLDKAQAKTDSNEQTTFTKVEVESEFPGSVKAWITYLTRNLRYPQRAMNNRIMGTVVIQFIINKRGNVESAEIYRSVEYSIDQEALRLIEESPLWIPAEQDGSRVRSYKRQPITFKMRI